MAGIKLRAIEKEDLIVLHLWRNSKNVMPYCRQYRPLSKQDMEIWYQKLTEDKDYNLTNDLFIINNGADVIGVGGLVRIDWRNRKAELSFYVEKFDKKVVTEAILHLLEYAHKTLGIRKVYWPVYSFNPHLPVYEETMQREYVAKEEYYWEGKWHDRVILVSYA